MGCSTSIPALQEEEATCPTKTARISVRLAQASICRSIARIMDFSQKLEGLWWKNRHVLHTKKSSCDRTLPDCMVIYVFSWGKTNDQQEYRTREEDTSEERKRAFEDDTSTAELRSDRHQLLSRPASNQAPFRRAQIRAFHTCVQAVSSHPNLTVPKACSLLPLHIGHQRLSSF